MKLLASLKNFFTLPKSSEVVALEHKITHLEEELRKSRLEVSFYMEETNHYKHMVYSCIEKAKAA